MYFHDNTIRNCLLEVSPSVDFHKLLIIPLLCDHYCELIQLETVLARDYRWRHPLKLILYEVFYRRLLKSVALISFCTKLF